MPFLWRRDTKQLQRNAGTAENGWKTQFPIQKIKPLQKCPFKGIQIIIKQK